MPVTLTHSNCMLGLEHVLCCSVVALLQVPFTLKSLLEAADVPPPYILVGHGMGGQLALQVRGWCRPLVAARPAALHEQLCHHMT